MTRTTVRKRTSVHEKTVKDAAKHAADQAAARKRPRRKAGNKNGAITHIKVDERVMEVVKKLAQGDCSRVEIHSATSVTVHNPGWKKIP